MADIHVLTGNMISGRKVMKTYAFHFTIDPLEVHPNAGEDPELVAFQSQVPDIEALELADIKAGTVVEQVVQVEYDKALDDSEIVVKVRATYADREPDIVLRYGEKYRQYLTAISA